MYSLVLIVALAQGPVAPAGDLPATSAVAPPGAANPSDSPLTAAGASQRTNGGFFRRLFHGQTKDTPAAAPAAKPTPPNSTTDAAPASPAKPKGGFFHNLFKCNDHECLSTEQEKKWEKSCWLNAD